MITMTDAAANKLRELIARPHRRAPGESSLRIKVVGGGCSGFQYELIFDFIKPSDKVFGPEDVKVVCDPKSYIYVNGVIIDYVEGLMGSGFKIENPNAKGTCGCGESFHA